MRRSRTKCLSATVVALLMVAAAPNGSTGASLALVRRALADPSRQQERATDLRRHPEGLVALAALRPG